VKEMKQNYQEYRLGGWDWIESEAISEHPKKKKAILGKYLFYSEKPEPLMEIARKEIAEYGFPVAKVILPYAKILDEFVLCLYDYQKSNDEKMYERFAAYQESHNVRYWKWKSEEETARGEYEPEFLRKRMEKIYKSITEKELKK